MTGAVWSEPMFRRLWTANLFGMLGSRFALFALTVTPVVVLGAGSPEVALIAAASQLGWWASLPIGVWIDRWRRGPVLVATSALRAVVLASVAVSYLSDLLTITQMVVVAAVLGLCEVFFVNAHDAFVTVLVGRARVLEARARLSVADQATAAAGPAAAGLLLTWVAGPLLYVVAAGLELVAVGLLRTVRPVEVRPATDSRQRFGPALRTGLRTVLVHPVLRTLMLRNLLVNAGAGVLTAVLPVFILSDIGLRPELLGLITAIGSAAGIVGAAAALRLIRRFGDLRMLL